MLNIPGVAQLRRTRLRTHRLRVEHDVITLRQVRLTRLEERRTQTTCEQLDDVTNDDR